MRLVLHIGATKTASTSLQLSLQSNEKVLAEHGIYVPRTARSRRSTASHHNLAWQVLREQRFRPDRGTWEQLLAEVREVDPPIALLSSEAFARVAAGKRRPFWVKALREADCQVELLYVVREPLARINSMFSQVVKTFGPADRFADYAEEALSSGFYNLDRSFRFWYGDKHPSVRELTTFTAIRFDDFIERSPLECVLDVLGTPIPSERLTMLQWESNVSPGPVAVEAFRLLRNHLRTADSQFDRRSAATTEVSQLAQRTAVELGWYQDRYWAWDPDLAKDAAKRLARSNERFAKAVWDEPWPFTPPVDRPTSAVDLARLGPKTRRAVMTFVDELTTRYFRLRRREADGETSPRAGRPETPVEADDLAP
jgi:hypothetical protein